MSMYSQQQKENEPTPEQLEEWRRALDECYQQARDDFTTCMNEHNLNQINSSHSSHTKSSSSLTKLWDKKKEIRELSKNSSNSEQVTYLFRNSPPASNFYKWLGYSEFEYPNISIMDLFAFIANENDMEQRKKWDPDLEEYQIIYSLDKNWRICLQVYNTNSRFVSNREFVIQYDIYEECEDVMWLVCKSISNFPEIEDEKAPYRKGNVRGIVHSVAWRIEKSGDKFKLSFCIHSDPGGMISSTIYNLVSEKQALNTYRVVKALNI